MLSEMRIFAVDPGTEKTGWAFAIGNHLQEFGVLQVAQEAGLSPTVYAGQDTADPWHRCYVLHLWLKHKLYELEVGAVGIELPTHERGNPHTDRVIAGAFMSAYLAARSVNAMVEIFRPAEVKATGYHKKARRDATLLAREHLKKGLVSEDEADALGLWQATWAKLLERYRLEGHG